jgi:hypothetical protein
MPPAAALRLYGECPTDGLTFEKQPARGPEGGSVPGLFVCTPKRRGGEVVTQRSAKPLCKGSIPFRASNRVKNHVIEAFAILTDNRTPCIDDLVRRDRAQPYNGVVNRDRFSPDGEGPVTWLMQTNPDTR